MWVYERSKLGDCYTVGFYKPDGTWEPESDYPTPDEAAWRVHFLNGGAAVRDVGFAPTFPDYESHLAAENG